MTKANLTKYVGTAAGVVLAGIAAKYPALAPYLASVVSLLVGWLHLPQPGTVKAPS